MKNDLRLFVHDDIDALPVPFAIKERFIILAYKYVMQEDRIVFIGNIKSVSAFIELSKGKYCKELPSLKRGVV